MTLDTLSRPAPPDDGELLRRLISRTDPLSELGAEALILIERPGQPGEMMDLWQRLIQSSKEALEVDPDDAVARDVWQTASLRWIRLQAEWLCERSPEESREAMSAVAELEAILATGWLPHERAKQLVRFTAATIAGYAGEGPAVS